jgi:hypothetical protein
MRRAVRRCPTPRTATPDGSSGTVRGPAAGSAAVRPSGEVATAGRHRPHRTSAQPEPSAPMCLRRPVNPPGRRTPRRTRPPQRRRCSWPLCGMGPDTDRRCLTGRGHLLSAAQQRTSRVHWQNDQQPCPSSLRQKGRSGCVQAAAMEPVGGHLTAAGRHPAWTPRPPIRQRGRTQDRTPQAAAGQSADRSHSLQLLTWTRLSTSRCRSAAGLAPGHVGQHQRGIR